jgi:glutaminyl-peptide cyclotransferase
MFMHSHSALLFSVLLALVPSGTNAETNTVPPVQKTGAPKAVPAPAKGLVSEFDAQRAYAAVRQQVEFGPRPSGSDALAMTRQWIIMELSAMNYAVTEQSFEEDTPRGLIRFTNIIARQKFSFPKSFTRSLKPTLILASHYDTKWMPEIRFLGANDSASSTAVLLEMARAVSHLKFTSPEFNLEFVFFDGEEAAVEYSETDGLHGSRHYVKKLTEKQRKKIKGMVLLDMVGDSDLMVEIPDGDPGLTQGILRAAEAVGHRNYFTPSTRSITDDHIPFQQAGIPAVDLIDFEFCKGNRCWHTAEDNLSKISAGSLRIVGETVLEFIQAGFRQNEKKRSQKN